MKRKALLIGNTSGLPGVKIDLERFSLFLQSNTGGAWRENEEIEKLPNVDKALLLNKIAAYRLAKFDYVIVMFSGHGGQIRQTVLELNSKEEKIEESCLWGIAPRQLNIYDCCRCFLKPTLEDMLVERVYGAVAKSESGIRYKYDNRIMSAMEQQVCLYSSSKGEASYDSNEGGIYLQNLLKRAKSINGAFKSVGLAHEEAIEPTRKQSLAEKGKTQNPDASLPKCMSSQQLIFSINPMVV